MSGRAPHVPEVDDVRAVQFEHIREPDRERIIRFVVDRRRLERARGRL